MKLKTILIILLIAAAAFIGYKWYTSKKEDKDHSENSDKNQQPYIQDCGGAYDYKDVLDKLLDASTKNPYAKKDTSKFAEYANISTADALKLAKEAVEIHGYYDKFVTDDMETLWLPQIQFDLKDLNVKYYNVSERTWNALVEAGYQLED